jgi:hypothetical protein
MDCRCWLRLAACVGCRRRCCSMAMIISTLSKRGGLSKCVVPTPLAAAPLLPHHRVKCGFLAGWLRRRCCCCCCCLLLLLGGRRLGPGPPQGIMAPHASRPPSGAQPPAPLPVMGFESLDVASLQGQGEGTGAKTGPDRTHFDAPAAAAAHQRAKGETRRRHGRGRFESDWTAPPRGPSHQAPSPLCVRAPSSTTSYCGGPFADGSGMEALGARWKRKRQTKRGLACLFKGGGARILQVQRSTGQVERLGPRRRRSIACVR